MASLMSAIHYNTFAYLDPTEQILYPYGLACLMIGVCALVHWSKDADADADAVVTIDVDGNQKSLILSGQQQQKQDSENTNKTTEII